MYRLLKAFEQLWPDKPVLSNGTQQLAPYVTDFQNRINQFLLTCRAELKQDALDRSARELFEVAQRRLISELKDQQRDLSAGVFQKKRETGQLANELQAVKIKLLQLWQDPANQEVVQAIQNEQRSIQEIRHDYEQALKLESARITREFEDQHNWQTDGYRDFSIAWQEFLSLLKKKEEVLIDKIESKTGDAFVLPRYFIGYRTVKQFLHRKTAETVVYKKNRMSNATEQYYDALRRNILRDFISEFFNEHNFKVKQCYLPENLSSWRDPECNILGLVNYYRPDKKLEFGFAVCPACFKEKIMEAYLKQYLDEQIKPFVQNELSEQLSRADRLFLSPKYLGLLQEYYLARSYQYLFDLFCGYKSIPKSRVWGFNIFLIIGRIVTTIIRVFYFGPKAFKNSVNFLRDYSAYEEQLADLSSAGKNNKKKDPDVQEALNKLYIEKQKILAWHQRTAQVIGQEQLAAELQEKTAILQQKIKLLSMLEHLRRREAALARAMQPAEERSESFKVAQLSAITDELFQETRTKLQELFEAAESNISAPLEAAELPPEISELQKLEELIPEIVYKTKGFNEIPVFFKIDKKTLKQVLERLSRRDREKVLHALKNGMVPQKYYSGIKVIAGDAIPYELELKVMLKPYRIYAIRVEEAGRTIMKFCFFDPCTKK